MPLQCEAVGAKRIFSCDAPVRKKLLVGVIADWTGYLLASIKLGEYLHRQRAHRLKDRPWDVADNKADDGFHGVLKCACKLPKEKGLLFFFWKDLSFLNAVFRTFFRFEFNLQNFEPNCGL